MENYLCWFTFENLVEIEHDIEIISIKCDGTCWNIKRYSYNYI